MLCSFNDCSNVSRAHTLCSGHLMQRSNGKTLRALIPRRTGCSIDGCGAYHKLICSVNAEVMGRWMVRERVNGELRGGTQSVFAFNQWEMAVGSGVSPTILINFIPTGLTVGISLEYRMNTEYMRKGVSNFNAGVNI